MKNRQQDEGATHWRLSGAVICVCLFLAVVPAAKIGVHAEPLKQSAEPAPKIERAIDGVLDLFRQKSVVAIGDDHGLAQEEAFYIALIRDPRFAEEVGNVVVEFGGAASQDIIDRYVNGADVPLTELRRVWTETVGFVPGPTSLGYVNFYANVRALNLKLPPEHRIKVWLGDPKIDWSTINSFRDLAPYLRIRDDNFVSIIDDEILSKQKKALLIIGALHLSSPDGPGLLRDRIKATYPGALAVVWPFTGYLEPECNAKVAARAADWPVPAIAAPVQGTWVKSELELPGCDYLPPDQLAPMAEPPPGMRSQESGNTPSAQDLIGKEMNLLSGATSDAILYLGPPDSFTESPIEPDIYLDPIYFKEQNRRLRCCSFGGGTLNWDQLVQDNSVIPKKIAVEPQVEFFGPKAGNKKKVSIPQ